MRIIRGLPEHARSILNVRRAVRVDTYAGYAETLTAEYLTRRYKITPEIIAGEAAKLGNAQSQYFLAKDDARVIGYVKTERSPRQSICLLHILAGYQGRGIGSELMRRAFDGLDLTQPIYLEVVEGNDRAMDWYKRIGFKETGRVIDGTPIPAGGYLSELEMVKVPLL